jgi:hypothetical protein
MTHTSRIKPRVRTVIEEAVSAFAYSTAIRKPRVLLLGTHCARGLEDRRPARDFALHEIAKRLG